MLDIILIILGVLCLITGLMGCTPSKPQITEDGIPDVDLSAIRQQISEEVQRIYEDDQNS